MSTDMKIVILDSYVTAGDYNWPELNQFGNVVVFERTSQDQVVERCKDATAIFTNKVIISNEIMNTLPSLKFIGIMATGINVVDLTAATNHGITVCNVPAYSTQSVVQHVFALLLNITNNIATYANSVLKGDWLKSTDFSYLLSPIHELNETTIGIYGLGNIGMSIANVAHSFGMRVIALTSKSADNLPQWITAVDKSELFSFSDVITLNAPLTDDNKYFVNQEALSLMKPTAIIINTARGGLVDENALADALNSKRLYAAALDVLSSEPPQPNNPLLNARNCFITPHIAWASEEARSRLRQICIENLKAWTTGHPINVVNKLP
jgi:glycerate dehydrogenase